MRGLLFLVLLVLVASDVAGKNPANPVGFKLPSVAGTSLAGETVRFPEDLAGRPAVLLVAYRRGTQPDVDLWMAFLKAKHPEVVFYEVPTITGVAWRAMQGWIDGGMRGGVPKANWPRVVTLYGDAPILKEFLGDHGGYTTHVTVLDPGGKVVWFHASGYSGEASVRFGEALLRMGAATP
jgi:hypothetical protein